MEKYGPRVVIHAAAFTQVDKAEVDPDAAQAVNVEGTRAVAEACRRLGALLVYPSTDYVFSGIKHSYSEGDETGPLSVYGRTKLEGEEIARKLPRHLIVRTSWVFGDGHNFIRSILSAAKTNDELAVVYDQVGLPTYAADLAAGILELVERGAGGLFHLANSGHASSWAEMAEHALRVAGLTTRVRKVSTSEYASSRGGTIAPRPAFSVLDCSKAAALGVTLRPWQDAVADYVQEFA
jgi:dTDP-4-dehydrorhamnose reductase